MNALDKDFPILIYSANRFDATGNRRYVGGFADRLKGICFTFALSRLVNRDFYIDWDDPCRLEDIFDQNRINWTLPEGIKNNLPNLKTFNLIDEAFSDELRAIIKRSPLELENRIFNSAGSIVFNCNSLNFDLFQSHGQPLQACGIEAASEKSFLRSIFGILFSTQKIRDLPGYQDFINFKSSTKSIIGAQFRTGGDGQWNDPALDSIENSEAFSQSIIDYARKIKLDNFGVLLSTDSQIAKQRIGRYLGDRVHFFCYPDTPIHLERSAQPVAARGAMQVALEHLALSESDYVIVGAGEFGVTAAYLGNKTPIFYKSVYPPIGSWANASWVLWRKLHEFWSKRSSDRTKRKPHPKAS